MSYEYDPRYGNGAVPAPLRIPVPGMQQGVGLGDVIARMTGALGIRQCEPCKRRQEWLNRHFMLGGRR
jgi:hypothetical protein